MEYDSKGRIKRFGKNDVNIQSGHSVCNYCGRDMPSVWDTVCFICDRTFCYAHSIDFKGKWVCSNCHSKIEEE